MEHKDVTVTAKYYTFVSNKEKTQAVNKISTILTGKKQVAKKRLKSIKRKIKTLD